VVVMVKIMKKTIFRYIDVTIIQCVFIVIDDMRTCVYKIICLSALECQRLSSFNQKVTAVMQSCLMNSFAAYSSSEPVSLTIVLQIF
jgi:hypothetical protein